jgi:hypothetical protein
VGAANKRDQALLDALAALRLVVPVVQRGRPLHTAVIVLGFVNKWAISYGHKLNRWAGYSDEGMRGHGTRWRRIDHFGAPRIPQDWDQDQDQDDEPLLVQVGVDMRDVVSRAGGARACGEARGARDRQ